MVGYRSTSDIHPRPGGHRSEGSRRGGGPDSETQRRGDGDGRWRWGQREGWRCRRGRDGDGDGWNRLSRAGVEWVKDDGWVEWASKITEEGDLSAIKTESGPAVVS